MRVRLRGSQCEDCGEHFGFSARHYGVDGDRLHGELPRLPCSGDTHLSDDLIGPMLSALKHCGNPLFRRHNDRKLVSPETFVEVLLDVFSRVRSDEAFLLSLDEARLFFFVIQRPRQIVRDFLHERLLGDRIVAGNVCVELFPRLSSHGRRREGQSEMRHAFFEGLVVNQID